MRDQVWAIEAKASTNVGVDDLCGLKSFETFYGKKCRPVVAYLGQSRRFLQQVEVWPWQELLVEMFGKA